MKYINKIVIGFNKFKHLEFNFKLLALKLESNNEKGKHFFER